MFRLVTRAIVGFLVASVAFGVYITAAAPLVFGITRVVHLSTQSYQLISNLVPVLCFALALLTAWAIDRVLKKIPQASTPIAPPIITAPPLPNAPQSRNSRRWVGYFVAVLGLVGFIAIVFTAIALEINGMAARYVGQGAFLFMALSFWTGTVIVAVEKGYHALVGIVLGMISPVGLLILTLMPDLTHTRR